MDLPDSSTLAARKNNRSTDKGNHSTASARE
jgi:hypothetical protein